MTTQRITTREALLVLYGPVKTTSRAKEVPALTPAYAAFIAASPYLLLASVGPEGTDCSPKGDAPGFVAVLDDKTIAIPDRPGNNRIDNLLNILADGRVSVLFLVPGVGESLRINGRASITIDDGLMQRFVVEGKAPKSVILVAIDSVYFHCSKAILRSQLWDPERFVARDSLPSAGAMLKQAIGDFDAEAYDAELPARSRASLY